MSATRKPMTIGVAIDDRLPMKLHNPPVNPVRCSGASADTSDHVIEAKPFPKKAIDINTMTHADESV